MILPGIVTNITKFGAFVDIGIKQDGLVHISHLSNRYIKDLTEAVHLQQIVQVKVLAIDTPLSRNKLSIQYDYTPPSTTPNENQEQAENPTPHHVKDIQDRPLQQTHNSNNTKRDKTQTKNNTTQHKNTENNNT